MHHPHSRRQAAGHLTLLFLTMALVTVCPDLALAQASPFMMGATAIQTNILAWLTPVAIILVMVLGGMAMANRIVENCANTLILRCSSSEGGGTARFASQLIGDREVKRTTVSRSSRATELVGSVSHSEHYAVEPAVLPSQIEQLPDLAGYLKHASSPEWQRVRLDAVRRWESGRPDREAGSGRDSDSAQERGYGRE